jgi:hypothetical protein
MMEAFDLYNSLNLAQDLTPFIHLEKRKPQEQKIYMDFFMQSKTDFKSNSPIRNFGMKNQAFVRQNLTL